MTPEIEKDSSQPTIPRWLRQVVGTLADGEETAQARISIEYGWLCIRNDNGWLLWSAKFRDIPRDGLLLAGILETAAERHDEWLKDRESVESPNDQTEP